MKPGTVFLVATCVISPACAILGAGEIPRSTPAPGSALGTPIPPHGPRLQFTTSVYDFGSVRQGQTIRHTFVFTNIGETTLEIADVRAACGCTTAGNWDRKVEPGKTGAIPLQFDSSHFEGPVSKSVAVTCNDPGHPTATLTLSGTIWKPIEITPSVAFFYLDSENQTTQSQTLHVANNLEEPLEILAVSSTNRQFKATLQQTKPGKEFALLVTAIPPFTNLTTTASLTLKTSVLQPSNLIVSAYAFLIQPVTVSPQQITIPPGPLLNSYTSTLTITGRGTNFLRVTGSHTDVPGAIVTVHETQPGRVFNVQAVFPGGTRIAAGKPSKLTVTTDHPRFPELNVPIEGGQDRTTPSAAPAGVAGNSPSAGNSSITVPTRTTPMGAK